jgi:crotonobetainyl-CoA:carnitine CoA-transferase CaiB-like acyl-CoA transferase
VTTESYPDDSAPAAGPLAGIRVVELGAWVAGPAVAAVMADWGADVVKVEAPWGDPMRHTSQVGDTGINPPFEMDNRGKRSVVLDVGRDVGRAALDRLLAEADVFVTNLRPVTLDEWGLDPQSLLARFPTLVVATLTGFGDRGPDRDRPSYDMGGFWARSGAAMAHAVNGEPPLLRGAYGDHTTSMALVAGVNAALLERQRTGRGRHVSTSLLRAGMYTVGQDITYLQRIGRWFPFGRREVSNVLFNCYRTKDDRWLWLLALQPDRHWPNLAVAVDRPQWLADPRFETHAVRREHQPELLALLDEIFAARTLDEWARALDDAGMWWEPALSVEDAIAHEQAQAMGVLIDVEGVSGQGTIVGVAGPIDFDGSSRMQTRGVPALGEHSREVLREAGLADAEIDALSATHE